MSLQVLKFLPTNTYSPIILHFISSRLLPYHTLHILKTWIISSQIFCLLKTKKPKGCIRVNSKMKFGVSLIENSVLRGIVQSKTK